MKQIFLGLSLVLLLISSCSDETTSRHDATIRDDGAALCTIGELRCDGKSRSECKNGIWSEVETCDQACSPTLGCVVCMPGSSQCSEGGSQTCLPDGSAYGAPVACDEKLGLRCGASGRCEGLCSPSSLGTSYRGCEYYPTVTQNWVDSLRFEFAVAVANASSSPTEIYVEGGALAAPISERVEANDVKIIRLPWVDKLKSCSAGICAQAKSAHVENGAYHLRSTAPVVVYQFSPLDFRKNNVNSVTNDASLLMPVNAMGTSFIAASYGTWEGYPGLIAVTATQDETRVNIASNAVVASSAEFPVSQIGEYMMNAGDVIQILSKSGDFTGSRVSSDKPIQLIGGHYCTNLPHNIKACDHLEESIFPIRTLDARYVVSAPATSEFAQGRVRTIRVIATEANTTISAEPALSLRTLTEVGDFVDVVGDAADYVISADKKILVAEYMHGQKAGGSIGDPAMLLAVPVGQFRDNYTIHAPQNYTENWVNIVKPSGASVQIDGVDVTGDKAVGASEFSVVRFRLPSKSSGNYTFRGDQPFGITVYGYGQYTSYWYAGGLDLDEITLE